jgi:lipopolysaccharide export system protein LptC
MTLSRNTWTILLLILAVALSSWSIVLFNTDNVLPTKHNPKEVDIFMQDVVATMLNKQGLPAMKIVSPKIIHFPENDTTQILSPNVTVYRNTLSPWQINAKFAKTTQGIHKIYFWDHVEIAHAADAQNPETTLKTESLTVFPDKQIAKTDQPIVFAQPDTTVHAVGMLANMELGTIQLLSNAQGDYAPSS